MHADTGGVRRWFAGAVGTALVLGSPLLAGCGSGGAAGAGSVSPGGSSPPVASPQVSAAGGSGTGEVPGTSGGSGMPGGGPETSGAPGGSGQPPASGAPGDDAKAAITKAYQTFFSPDSSLDQTVAALQDGSTFKGTVASQGEGSNSSLASKASAKVSDIKLVSPTVATLQYTVYVGGKTMLPNQPGYAVKQDGHWKMAAYTFCGLMKLEMGDKAPDACDSAEATETPGPG